MNLAGVCYFLLTKKHLVAAAGLVSIISAEDDLSPGPCQQRQVFAL